MKLKVKGLLLAAGSSSRMGTPKQLLPWGQTTMIGHCISEAKRSKLDSLLVVLGAEAAQIQAAITNDATDIVINKHWSGGIASTIKTGVDQITSNDTVDGILIMLADQPLVSTDYLNKLIEAFDTSNRIVASTYDQSLGVPAIFGAAHFDLLMTLEGDRGAGYILNARRDSVKTIAASTELTDIDTMEAYTALRPPLEG